MLTAITAPAQSIGLTGNGTETNPYLINDKDDLTTLASAVNNSTAEENAGAFSGTYFRLEANIDMDGVEFTPIGNDFQHTFGGIFDGNGKRCQTSPYPLEKTDMQDCSEGFLKQAS